MVRIEMYNLKTILIQFKDQKKLKTYLIVRIELSLNDNMLKASNINNALPTCLKYLLQFKEMKLILFIDQQKVAKKVTVS